MVWLAPNAGAQPNNAGAQLNSAGEQPNSANAQSDSANAARRIEGKLPSGATWLAEVPPHWSGSLLLYSHGYARGPANPARHVPRDEASALLAGGYALLGSSYARTGWALQEAVPDQLAALDEFSRQVAPPKQVIAWGSSMGGLVTVALLEQHPGRFAGGLALCASAAGTLGMMNTALDGAFVFKALAAPASTLPLLFGASGAQAGAERADRAAWQAALDAAQASALGRARIALAATLAQVPGWTVAGSAQPDVADAAGQQQQLYRGLLDAVLLPRDDQALRAGGNFSWNTGTDYAALLARSGRQAWVLARYAEAGAALDDDLATLAATARISADPAAVAYMARHYQPTGRPSAPLLLLQTIADPVTLAELSADYAALAAEVGPPGQVAAAWLRRTGHCNFSTPELLVVLQQLQQRLADGRWGVDPSALNAAVQALGQGPTEFVVHRPAPLLRRCAAGACLGQPGQP